MVRKEEDAKSEKEEEEGDGGEGAWLIETVAGALGEWEPQGW